MMKRRSFLSLLVSSPALVNVPDAAELATFSETPAALPLRALMQRCILPFPTLGLAAGAIGEVILRPTRPFFPDRLVATTARPLGPGPAFGHVLAPVGFDILGLDATSDEPEPELLADELPCELFSEASYMPRMYFAPLSPAEEIVLRVRAREAGHIVCCLVGLSPQPEELNP